MNKKKEKEVDEWGLLRLHSTLRVLGAEYAQTQNDERREKIFAMIEEIMAKISESMK